MHSITTELHYIHTLHYQSNHWDLFYIIFLAPIGTVLYGSSSFSLLNTFNNEFGDFPRKIKKAKKNSENLKKQIKNYFAAIYLFCDEIDSLFLTNFLVIERE